MKGALKYLLFFRNVVFLKWLSQIVFLAGFISIVLRYLGNASTNFASTNIAFSWDFLGETPGVSIAEGNVYPASFWFTDASSRYVKYA